jgi:hypothetical protein
MLRNVARQISGRSEPSLPGSYNPNGGGGGGFSSLFSSGRSKDGSARSIHTAPTLQVAWRRLSLERKITWIATITSLLMLWIGWRALRYSNAGIYLNCVSHSCEIYLRPTGWGKPVRIKDLSKYQLLPPKAIKVNKDGTFLTDQDVPLTERAVPLPPKNNKDGSKQKTKYSQKKDATYKGPDEFGRYTTYAIILTDQADTVFPDDAEPLPDNQVHRAADLSPIRHLLDSYRDETDNGRLKYRIIPRKFGVVHSKRRVRTMIQKIESYVRRRRLKAVVSEDAPPSWQGVILIVMGFTVLILTFILGQFSAASASAANHHQSGPGVRRQQHQQQPQQQPRDPFRSATPSKYEVSTQPNISRRNNTTTRKRG